jgi:hypothetical protein
LNPSKASASDIDVLDKDDDLDISIELAVGDIAIVVLLAEGDCKDGDRCELEGEEERDRAGWKIGRKLGERFSSGRALGRA